MKVKKICVVVLLFVGIVSMIHGQSDLNNDGGIDRDEFGREYWNNISLREKYILICGYHYGLYWGSLLMAKVFPGTIWAVSWVAPGGQQTQYMLKKANEYYGDSSNPDKSLMFVLWPGSLPNKEIMKYESDQETY